MRESRQRGKRPSTNSRAATPNTRRANGPGRSWRTERLRLGRSCLCPSVAYPYALPKRQFLALFRQNLAMESTQSTEPSEEIEPNGAAAIAQRKAGRIDKRLGERKPPCP